MTQESSDLLGDDGCGLACGIYRAEAAHLFKLLYASDALAAVEALQWLGKVVALAEIPEVLVGGEEKVCWVCHTSNLIYETRVAVMVRSARLVMVENFLFHWRPKLVQQDLR